MAPFGVSLITDIRAMPLDRTWVAHLLGLRACALGATALTSPALLISGRRCERANRGRLALGFIGYGLAHLERAGNE